jgi:site-specific DNA recombinase
MNSVRGKRAILYRRVSTTDQRVFGNSLDAQRDALRTFCHTNGLEIIKEFQEDYSAKDFKNRKVFQELLHFAKKRKHEIDFLLVTQQDRFSRNQVESHRMVQQLKQWGIEVNFINSWVNWDDPYQHMSRTIQMAMPESEN